MGCATARSLRAHCLHASGCIYDSFIQGVWENVPEPVAQRQILRVQWTSCLCPGLRAEQSGTAGKAVATVSVQFQPKLIKMFLHIMFPADVGRQEIELNIKFIAQN